MLRRRILTCEGYRLRRTGTDDGEGNKQQEGWLNMPNHIMVIAPYWVDTLGAWVFDDPKVGLEQEPFVSGVPEMIDFLVKDIPNARNGFRMLFSATAFPGYQKKLTWRREEMGGNWYATDDPPMEGWLCPALFRYFDKAPPELYVKAEEVRDAQAIRSQPSVPERSPWPQAE